MSNMVNNANDLPKAESRVERYLNCISNGYVTLDDLPIPESTLDVYLDFIARNKNSLIDPNSNGGGTVGSQGEKGEKGDPGEAGTKWLYGDSNPMRNSMGNDGDFYLNIGAGTIFIKANGQWPSTPIMDIRTIGMLTTTIENPGDGSSIDAFGEFRGGWSRLTSSTYHSPFTINKTGDIVTLQGCMTHSANPSSGSEMFIMPLRHRPKYTVIFPVATSDGNGSYSIGIVSINQTGVVHYLGGSAKVVDLGGVSFKAYS